MLRTCCCERLKLRSTPSGTPCGALSANMSETATPWEFSVEGESGSESDERIGAGPRVSDRGGGEGDAAAVHGGVQTEDRPGGRRLQDAGRGRGVAAAGGAVLLAPDDVARGAGAGGTGRAPKKRGPARRVSDPRDKRIADLERESTRWRNLC